MPKNILENLFDRFNSKKIAYCIRGRYQHLPKTLDGGDVDILIERSSWAEAKKIIESLQFFFYLFTQPNLFYYHFDGQLGLVQLDILITNQFPKIKKYKKFFVPTNEEKIPNKKSFLKKIFTGTIRRFYWLFRGPLIVFEGPDGSGKTTNVKELHNALKKFPLKSEIIHFATKFKKKKPSWMKRFLTRIWSLLKVFKNVIVGKISLTDRYIYLTFRKHPPFFKKFLRFLAPKPNILFVTYASPKEIRKRKKGQKDLLNPGEIKKLYHVYKHTGEKTVLINTQKKKANENLVFTANTFLKSILK